MTKPVVDIGRKVQLNLRSVPANIRRLFKARCAEAGVTMEAAVVGFMEDVVLGDAKPGGSPPSHVLEAEFRRLPDGTKSADS